MHDLTGFQRDIMYVLADGEMYGLGVKEELKDYYSSEINHGRLYPNLDELIDQGLAEKRELDRRTNGYSLTDEGFEALESRRSWENGYIAGGDSPIVTEDAKDGQALADD